MALTQQETRNMISRSDMFLRLAFRWRIQCYIIEWDIKNLE
jgi:hypothetical protein